MVLKYLSGTGVPDPSRMEFPELLTSIDARGPSDTNSEWPSLVELDPVALMPHRI